MDHEAAKKLLSDECRHFECDIFMVGCKHKVWWPFGGHWGAIESAAVFEQRSLNPFCRCTAPPVAMVICHSQIQWWAHRGASSGVFRHFIVILLLLLSWPRPCNGYHSNRSAHWELKFRFAYDVMIVPFQVRWSAGLWSGDLSLCVSSGGEPSEFCDWSDWCPSGTLWLGEACDWMSELTLDSLSCSSCSLLASSAHNRHTGTFQLQETWWRIALKS